MVAVAGIALLFSCEKPEYSFETSMTPESVTGNAESNYLSLTVISPHPWAIVCSESWCKAIPFDGSPTSSSGTEVRLHLEDNTGIERSCVVSLVVEEKTVASSVIHQGYNPDVLLLGQTTFQLSGQDNHLEIPYRYDGVIAVEPLCEWISVAQVGQNSIILDIEPYEHPLKRKGSVRVTESDGEEYVLDIIQGDGFSDPQMLNYMVRQFDSDGDGFLSRAEAEVVENIKIDFADAGNSKLQILDGFDYFPNLKKLTIIGGWGARRGTHAGTFRKMYIDGHPKITTLLMDGDYLFTSLISVSNCPDLESVILHHGSDGDSMISVDISQCPKLHTLHIMNHFVGDYLSLLNMKGLPNLETLYINGAEFSEEPDFGLSEKLTEVQFYHVIGVKCVDFSKSINLESISWLGWLYDRESLSFLLLPSNRQNKIKTNLREGISVVYM